MAQLKPAGGSQLMRRAVIGVAGAVLIGAVLLAIGYAAGVVGGPGELAAASSSPTPAETTPSARPTEAPTPTLEPSPTPVPSPTPTPTPTLVPAPLTGMLVSPEAAAMHAIAVMVDDHADARPQAGFNAASIVWQAPAESGIPRYMMVFQDQVAGSIGPIRSAREYFLEWAAEWDAVYAHVGGSPQALDTLVSYGRGQWVFNADQFRWAPQYFWRITERLAPHNVYTTGEKMRELSAVLGATDEPKPAAWSFTAGAPLERRAIGGTITIVYPYETITYRYDTESNSYRRFINGSSSAQIDAADEQVVAPRNVVILRMHFGPLGTGIKGRLEADNVGSGEAFISSNGRTVAGTWSKAGVTSPTLLFGSDGKPVQLTAGQTFVQVISTDYDFTIDDGPVPPVVPALIPRLVQDPR